MVLQKSSRSTQVGEKRYQEYPTTVAPYPEGIARTDSKEEDFYPTIVLPVPLG
jgi:hypothetical protein